MPREGTSRPLTDLLTLCQYALFLGKHKRRPNNSILIQPQICKHCGNYRNFGWRDNAPFVLPPCVVCNCGN